MSVPGPEQKLDNARRRIAGEIRSLRQERHWTQAALAGQLGLSQSRLSEIERGDGSFTAEQFVAILKLFNVPPSHFASGAQSPDAQIQNTLARLGAAHLKESTEVLPSEALEEVHRAVREALVQETPRLITALAPVLVRNIDRISLTRLHLELTQAGLERRLAWLIENTLEAVRRELSQSPPRDWALRCRRAEVVLAVFLEWLVDAQLDRVNRPAPPDILDRTIRSRQTLDEVRASSSEISRRWSIVTQLQPEDFANALRAARAGN